MEIAKFVLEHSENEMIVMINMQEEREKSKTEMFLFKEKEEIECGKKIESICFEVYNYFCINIPYPSRKFRVVPGRLCTSPGQGIPGTRLEPVFFFFLIFCQI